MAGMASFLRRGEAWFLDSELFDVDAPAADDDLEPRGRSGPHFDRVSPRGQTELAREADRGEALGAEGEREIGVGALGNGSDEESGFHDTGGYRAARIENLHRDGE